MPADSRESAVRSVLIPGNGPYPNNPKFPLLLMTGVFALTGTDPAAIVEHHFRSTGWGGSWRNGIYDIHHFHSSAHEALGIYQGWVEVCFGGPGGSQLRARAGDLIVIPAGVSHQRVAASADFRVVGAYPKGQAPNMCFGKPEELRLRQKEAAAVPLPEQAPVLGHEGLLLRYWQSGP